MSRTHGPGDYDDRGRPFTGWPTPSPDDGLENFLRAGHRRERLVTLYEGLYNRGLSKREAARELNVPYEAVDEIIGILRDHDLLESYRGEDDRRFIRYTVCADVAPDEVLDYLDEQIDSGEPEPTADADDGEKFGTLVFRD